MTVFGPIIELNYFFSAYGIHIFSFRFWMTQLFIKRFTWAQPYILGGMIEWKLFSTDPFSAALVTNRDSFDPSAALVIQTAHLLLVLQRRKTNAVSAPSDAEFK